MMKSFMELQKQQALADADKARLKFLVTTIKLLNRKTTFKQKIKCL